MSRVAMILAAALLWAVPAAAQAPSVHPGTKLAFGASVGGAKFESSMHVAAANGHGAGDTYIYSVGKMQLTVDVFDAGRHVPPGSGNPTVSNQFETEANAAEQQIRTAGYQRFERPTVPSTCSYGATAFRCLVYSAQTGGTRLYSKLLLT